MVAFVSLNILFICEERPQRQGLGRTAPMEFLVQSFVSLNILLICEERPQRRGLGRTAPM